MLQCCYSFGVFCYICVKSPGGGVFWVCYGCRLWLWGELLGRGVWLVWLCEPNVIVRLTVS